MAYIVTDKCVDCVYTSCVDGCPVEAFHEAPDCLYINPDSCIDCDACVPACPPDAIYEDEEQCIEEEGNDESVKKNYEFFGHKWTGEPL